MTKQSSSTVLFAVKIGVKLLLICGIVALLLAAVNHITKPVIAQKEQAEEQQTLKHFFPSMTQAQTLSHDTQGVVALYAIYEDQTLLGYCCTAGAKGFSDTVEAMVGFDAQTLQIKGVTIVSCTDAPGKNKISDASFLHQFSGQSNADTVDAISGATYSSQAVRQCVNIAAQAVKAAAEPSTQNSDTTQINESESENVAQTAEGAMQ